MASWWERFPGRLDAELEDFRARGLAFELDEALRRDAGRILVRGSITHEGRDVELEVLYPDLFPYLRPEVFAPGEELDRHQNPRDRNLCLLERGTSSWNPEETAAWLVAERVPKLLALTEAEPEEMRRAEAPQGEPVSAYFPGVAGTVVFVPAAALELDPKRRAGSGRLRFGAEARPRVAVRALLGELVVRERRKSKPLGKAEEPLLERFGGEEIAMRWARLDGPPDGFDPEAVFAAADRVQPGFGRPPWKPVADGEIAVTGVVFKEEVRQGEYDDAWLFAVRARRRAGGQLHELAYLIRGERLTREDLGARVPMVAALREATVAQVGGGAIGAPLALELIRNQVGALRLIEYDEVEAPQIVRWPFGVDAVGHRKLEMLAGFARRNYPYTDLEPFQHRLGQTALERQGREEDEFDLMERFLDGATLVIDASAEIGLQQLLSDLAGERPLPQIYASATEGARGGQVALIVPGQGGCWYCWKQFALDGDIPLPPFEPGGNVQPRGCTHRTFTGASFDLLPVSVQAARVAAALARDTEGLESKVWVLELPEDGIDPPVWNAHAIGVHPDCPRCSAGG